MKKLILGAIALALLGTVALAGVNSIQKNGTSSSGKTMYKIKCSNGKSYRIYRSGGEWYEGFLGAVGGNYRDLKAQAKVMCR